MENKKTIIEKIKKIMALASNNPNEQEAIAAALKAQKLMAEYHIEENELGEEVNEKNIDKIICSVGGKSQKWKISLGIMLAKNFRCKCYLMGSEVVFYGFDDDIKICSEVYHSLYKIGVKLSDKKKREYREMYGTAKGVRNTFCSGFVAGIRSELEKQCTALMIVVPKEVEDKYKEMTAGFSTRNCCLGSMSGDRNIYNDGFQSGKDAVRARGIESKY